MRSRHRPLIAAAAAAHALDPRLLEAQVWVESSDREDAFRYEPQFYVRYLLGTPFAVPYGPLAACSYGLLQILLQVAIELGYPGRPEDLFLPAVGLDWGARKLRSLLDQVHDPDAALAAYNGGLSGNRAAPYRTADYVLRVRTAERALDA